MYERIKGNLLKDQVYDKVAEMVANAELLPGDRITENQLSERFGISLTPVREALIKLSSNGIIHKVAHKGFYINKYSDEEVNEIYEVLVVLQEFAIRLKINDFTESDIAAQETLLHDMETAYRNKDYNEYLKANHRLHDYYVKQADNKFLFDIYHNLSTLPIPVFYFSDESKNIDSMKKGIEDHHNIIEALRNKDIESVRNILMSHYFDTNT